jgi:uncharacterized membrane protein YfcA
MLVWTLGFTPDKARATAMRATAGSAIAAVLGVVWRCSLPAAEYGGPIPHSEDNIIHFAPQGYGWMVPALFVGATIGAILCAKATPKPDQLSLRRAYLFVGVCIGVYVAAEAVHFSTASAARTVLVHGVGEFLLLGAISGALTQVLSLSSGVLLMPALYYFAGLSAQQSAIISLAVIGLAALLPAWSYTRRGLHDKEYGSAAIIGGMIFAFVAGGYLVTAPARLVLMMFALVAMFFSAREISRIALESTVPTPPRGPDLS